MTLLAIQGHYVVDGMFLVTQVTRASIEYKRMFFTQSGFAANALNLEKETWTVKSGLMRFRRIELSPNVLLKMEQQHVLPKEDLISALEQTTGLPITEGDARRNVDRTNDPRVWICVEIRPEVYVRVVLARSRNGTFTVITAIKANKHKYDVFKKMSRLLQRR